MTVRERQVTEALATRERQVKRALRIERIVEDQPTHHGYAVCVKERTLGGDRVRYGTDDYEADLARYDHVREQWWEDVQEIGARHGFADVFSAGRSSGYAVPHPQPNTQDMYDEDVAEWLRDVFGPFAGDVLDLLASYVDDWNAGGWDDED